MLEQLRNPGSAFGTRTGELLSLVSVFLCICFISPLSQLLCTLGRQKSSGHCTVPKFISSLFKRPSQTCWLVLIPDFWKGNVLSLVGPGIQSSSSQLGPGDHVSSTDVPRSGSTCQRKGVVLSQYPKKLPKPCILPACSLESLCPFLRSFS